MLLVALVKILLGLNGVREQKSPLFSWVNWVMFLAWVCCGCWNNCGYDGQMMVYD